MIGPVAIGLVVVVAIAVLGLLVRYLPGAGEATPSAAVFGTGLRSDGLPEVDWVEVPAGEFTMGSEVSDDEQPVRQVTLPAFLISRYETTYAQYKAFLDAPDGYANEDWLKEPVPLAASPGDRGQQYWPIDARPVENVSWFEAMAYCRWLTDRLRASGDLGDDEEIRLPKEEEWEKAARGTEGLEFPWGETFDTAKANTSEAGLGETTDVGSYPDGASPYGLLDMSGNVFEWTLTDFDSRTSDDLTSDAARVFRGGSWDDPESTARGAFRGGRSPDSQLNFLGFRVVYAPIDQ